MCLKPRVKVMNGFVRFLTLGNATGISLAPFGIYIRKDRMNNTSIVRHEKIHWAQQLEMGILLFYIWYFIEWFIKLFIHGTKSYHAISFEREAKLNQLKPTYLDKRKHFAWLKYISHEKVS